MGLDLYAGRILDGIIEYDLDGPKASRSYGGFHSFREHLAWSAGIGNLNDFQGFGGIADWRLIHHPLVRFLDHSDCDGTLSAEQCVVIAPSLRFIVSAWPTEPEDSILAEHRRYGLELASLMEHCVATGQTLIFS